MEKEDVAANVRAALARRRLTARKLAQELRVDERGLRRRLRGEVAFAPGELVAIAHHLGMTVDELLRGDTK